MAQNLTTWFPETMKPVRVGVYEVTDYNEKHRAFAYWNGKRFGYRCWAYEGEIDEQEAINDALGFRRAETCLSPRCSWRGLAKEPK